MSLPADYFEQMYAHDPDPWGFRTRAYEARKRAVTLASLPQERYPSIFEPGCSNGTLTTDLAARADEVLAMDVSTTALDLARQTAPDNVVLRRGAVPGEWPEGHFGLVVLSEVGYYLDCDDCRTMAQRAMTSTRDVVAVHWRHRVPDYPLLGDEVHAVLENAAQECGLRNVVSHRERDFRLDVWSHDPRSVAERLGMAMS